MEDIKQESDKLKQEYKKLEKGVKDYQKHLDFLVDKYCKKRVKE